MKYFKNNTGDVTKLGYLCKIDPKDHSAIVYAGVDETNILGVIATVVPRYAPCEVITTGVAKVFVSERCAVGNTIRSAKSTDNISRGTSKPAKDTDVPYFRIGTATESGKGLVMVMLSLANIHSDGGSETYLKLDQTTQQTTVGTFHFPTATIGGSANYTAFEADGTMEMHGDATVWDDMRITPGNFDRPGASDPAYVLYYPNAGGLGTYLTEWAIDDIASFTIQIPHGYHVGEDIYVHLHWTPGARGNEENGATVGWKLDYSWANINGNFGDMQTANLSDACDGIDHKHQMTAEATITGTDKSISSMLLCNIRRTDTGTDDTWAGTISGQLPLLLEVDFHIPLARIGSRLRSTV